jgi:lipoprotein-anchoring transpeptidase ErfK/SrfK
MKMFAFAAAITAALWTAVPASAGTVVAQIDVSTQRMVVKVNGKPAYNWAVSTARKGYRTPIGSFRPKRLERMWYSTIYDNAPMPYSIFFLGGYAAHGTTATGRLGAPASHGCARLATGNAAKLYSLVRQHGMGNTRIVVTQ